ncbi:response regulator [Pleionea sp. CnH1-48]|uniref:response regulator n=1 Tax=Pleionea sp. CnH1-48 TaxID=2954494 RepID=UPI0020983303|nr:response regulator [Pleionea sp. CnH1-48]MCO7224198.1 response regulator [Pleionea sp. CnH1-48]
MNQPQKNSVLIVDDEPAIRLNLAIFLQDESFNVVVAESAEEGFSVLEQTPASVGIVDLRLPGLDGHQFIIKAHQKYPDMKFIIHTGSHEFQLTDELKAIGLTANNIWLKPVLQMDKLVDAISNIQMSERSQ